MSKSFAVLGLGRYGRSIAETLAENGVEVLAIDKDLNIVDDVAEIVPICKCADITDAEHLRTVGVGDVDVAIIAVASDLETSILATTICKELGVSEVIVKCANDMHKEILLRVGADRAIIPEKDAGALLAKNLMLSKGVDMFDISRNISIVEIDVKEEWVGKTIAELNLRKKFGINIIAVKDKKKVFSNVKPELVLTQEMKLVVVTHVSKLKKVV